MSARDYLINVRQALQISLSQSDIYLGREGALRLAREIGACLSDSSPKEAYDGMRDSYNYVCVIGYNLKPPVDADEWNNAVISKMKARVIE
jgi:hypothetical protein